MYDFLSPAKAFMCTSSQIGHDTLQLWLIFPSILPFSQWDMASPVDFLHPCTSCSCHTSQSVEMYNDSSSLGKSSFKMMGSTSVLVRLRRTIFRSGLLSAEPTFRIREYERQGMGPWAHLVYHLHLVGQGEWMPTVDKMDKTAWWESEVLSLEGLRQKLEWKPIWLWML